MTTENRKRYLTALKWAFPCTIPILAGFWFVGIAYGLYMKSQGFSFIYPLLMSLVIFGGSLEFLTVSMLVSTFSPITALLVALTVQARHLFYGISLLDKYKNIGKKRAYLIYGLCDETFSINYSAKLPGNVDKGLFYFFVTLLNHVYWVSGATLGGLIGKFITFDLKGLDFVMTAMFVVIFTDQCMNEKTPYPALIGILMPLLCLRLFGAEYFLIPSMIGILLLLTKIRKPIEKKLEI